MMLLMQGAVFCLPDAGAAAAAAADDDAAAEPFELLSLLAAAAAPMLALRVFASTRDTSSGRALPCAARPR